MGDGKLTVALTIADRTLFPLPLLGRKSMSTKTRRVYVGHKKGGGSEVLRLFDTPTQERFGDTYAAFTGPFRTVRGAKALIHYGVSNPHMTCVADAERIGKQYADELKPLPTRRK
jgi:hypothetical protein